MKFNKLHSAELFAGFIALSQVHLQDVSQNPACVHLLKVNSGNTRSMFEIYSKLTVKTTEWRYLRRSSVFIPNFEQISGTVLYSFIDSKQVNAGLENAYSKENRIK